MATVPFPGDAKELMEVAGRTGASQQEKSPSADDGSPVQGAGVS